MYQMPPWMSIKYVSNLLACVCRLRFVIGLLKNDAFSRAASGATPKLCGVVACHRELADSNDQHSSAAPFKVRGSILSFLILICIRHPVITSSHSHIRPTAPLTKPERPAHDYCTLTSRQIMASNALAKTLKALHKPSDPLIIPNIWDIPSLNAVASLNSADAAPVKAVATASWAVAAALGIKDEELTYEQNLSAIQKIGPTARNLGLPLSVDLQDGYGAKIGEAVAAAVSAGAVGANIEDSIPSAGLAAGIEGSLYSLDEQVERLKAALKAASDAGCPDFALNARCDVFALAPDASLDDDTRMKEAIKRGRAFIDAGATTVFFWGAGRGIRDAEVRNLVKELDGKVAVKTAHKSAGLSTGEISGLGVARISFGPSLYLIAMEATKNAASTILGGGKIVA